MITPVLLLLSDLTNLLYGAALGFLLAIVVWAVFWPEKESGEKEKEDDYED